jgi:hypothetical protein
MGFLNNAPGHFWKDSHLAEFEAYCIEEAREQMEMEAEADTSFERNWKDKRALERIQEEERMRREKAIAEEQKRKERIERERLKFEDLAKKAPEPEPDWEALVMQKYADALNKQEEEPGVYCIRVNGKWEWRS